MLPGADSHLLFIPRRNPSFLVENKYYLFFYAQKSIDTHFLYKSVDVLQELDSKQRKIRSLRGFFLYALEIIENAKDYEILSTNLQPFFWRKVENIIRQNKKGALLEFLFGSTIGTGTSYEGLNLTLEETIQNLQDQVNSLQNRIIELENQTNHLKDALRTQNKAPEAIKPMQQGDCTLYSRKSPSSLGNDSEVRDSTSRGKDMESKSFSEAPRSLFQEVSSIIYPQVKRKPKIA